jgi:hypothetical protein
MPAGCFLLTRATLASDASDSSVAAFCIDGLPSFEFVSLLTEEEKSWSSLRRELLAFQRVQDERGSLLSSRGAITIFWLTYNSSVTKFLSKGSSKLAIMLQILHLLRSAWDLSLDLCQIWVSRDNPLLQKADALSKAVDTDNWSVCEGDFDFLASSFGPFTVDLFAVADNAKVARFFSFSFEAGCLSVDAFSFSWDG